MRMATGLLLGFALFGHDAVGGALNAFQIAALFIARVFLALVVPGLLVLGFLTYPVFAYLRPMSLTVRRTLGVY